MALGKAKLFIASLLSVSFAALYSGPLYARANLSGLWWDPDESGWGVTLDHQAQFLFATFFIYGETGTPTWLVAQLDASSADQTTFKGPVYTTTGTPFDRPFVASDTKVTQVGSATLTVQNDNRLGIDYSVNGINVAKVVVRQTNKPLLLVGSYDGLATTGPFSTDSTSFSISTNGTNLVISRAAFFAGTCEFSGVPAQFGYRLSIAGTYRCSDFSEGTWTTDDLTLQDGTTLIGTINKTSTATSTSSFNPSSERWLAIRLR